MGIPSRYLISPNPSEFPCNPYRKIRLGILASGKGTNFEAIQQAILDRELNAEIVILVFNKENAEVKEKAIKHNIPWRYISHRKFAKREQFDTEVADVLGGYGIDLVIMAGWMRVATGPLLRAFPNRILNIHPSLLPMFKGKYAVELALEAEVKISGCTVHYVTEELDAGSIIMQAAVPAYEHDTVETLHKRIQAQEYQLYPLAIELIGRNIGGIL